MKILKSYLLLGVASAFLLSGTSLAEKDEGVIGSLFDDVDGVAQADKIQPEQVKQRTKKQQVKKAKKKLTAEEIEVKKAAGAAKRDARAAKNNQEVDLDTSINDPAEQAKLAEAAAENAAQTVNVVEVAGKAVETAQESVKKAQDAIAALTQQTSENAKLVAELHDVKAANAAKLKKEEQKANDAAEYDRLKKATSEDHRSTAEDNVLAEHQAKFATAIVTTADGAVDVDATAANEANEGQAQQLKEMDVGTDITAAMVNAPSPVAQPDSDAQSADESQTASVKANTDAPQDTDVKSNDVAPAKESKKEAGKAKPEERANKKNTSKEEDLDTSIKAKKPRKKLDEEGKKAHEEKMKKQKEDKEAKKTDKKSANEKKKSDQIAAGDKKRGERAKNKEKNKNKDYTAILNGSDASAETE